MDQLLLQAYILVHKAGFTYADVKKMNKIERSSFLKFILDSEKALGGN